VAPSYSGGKILEGSWFEASLDKYFRENLSQKNPSQKRAGGVVQGVGPEFKPQYHKNKVKVGKLVCIIE
jgi:hypothetical protein